MAQVTAVDRRVRSSCGAELVEFAFVLPLLLFVVAGIVDFGFLFQRYEVVTNAAREGARIAVLPGYCTADVQARVQAYLSSGGVPTPAGSLSVGVTTVSVPVAGGPAVTARRIAVTYTHRFFLLGPLARLVGGSSYTTIPLTGIAVMRPEVPTAPGC